MTEPDLFTDVLGGGFEDRLPVDPGARQRSLDVAMAAFDAAVGEDFAPVRPVELESPDVATFPRRRRVLPFTILAVAALLVVVAGALAVLTRGGDERVRTGVAENPVEQPRPSATPVPVVPAPADDWSSWAAASDPPVALTCVARTTFREVLDAELPPPNAVGPAPESQWTLAQLRGIAGLGVALAPAVDGSTTAAALSDADLVAEADVAAFADAGSPDDTFADKVSAVRASMQANPLWEPNPDGCWLDATVARSQIADTVAEIGAASTVRCLAAETLDRALAWQLADLDTDRTPAISAALALLTNYTADQDVELLDLLGEAALLRPTAVDGADSIAAVRLGLEARGLGLEESSCRVTGT